MYVGTNSCEELCSHPFPHERGQRELQKPSGMSDTMRQLTSALIYACGPWSIGFPVPRWVSWAPQLIRWVNGSALSDVCPPPADKLPHQSSLAGYLGHRPLFQLSPFWHLVFSHAGSLGLLPSCRLPLVSQPCLTVTAGTVLGAKFASGTKWEFTFKHRALLFTRQYKNPTLFL